MAVKKYYVSWASVERFVDELIKFYDGAPLKGVYGLPRGGLVLAVMISHRMNIPLLMAPVEGCLIVDDISDTGESLIHYAKNSSALEKPKYNIATMYYRKGSQVVPDVFLDYKEDRWIVFPWEEKEPIGGLRPCSM